MFVIVWKEVLGKVKCYIFIMLDYCMYVKKGFVFNILLVFFIYVSMLILWWIKVNGGIFVMQ